MPERMRDWEPPRPALPTATSTVAATPVHGGQIATPPRSVDTASLQSTTGRRRRSQAWGSVRPQLAAPAT
jgi:hypothetical protein